MVEKDALGMLQDIISKTEVLSADEETFYMARFKLEGRSADREKLIVSNLRFALLQARKYPRTKGMDLEDYLGEAIIGLIIAVDKFDILRSTKLVTFAIWWIKRTISVAMWRMNDLYIPLNKWTKMVTEEIRYGKEQLKKIQVAMPLVAKLDDGEEGTLEIPDERFEEWMERVFLRESIEKCMDEVLTEREKDIIKLRFGWDGFLGEYTLDEVGVVIGLTRERVRQIESKALDKLRARYNKVSIKRLQIAWGIGS